MRGPDGTTYDRILLILFGLCCGLAAVLMAWRGHWASVLWP